MTLQEFLNVTAETDDRDLRLALALKRFSKSSSTQ